MTGKARREASFELRRQVDLGHQHQHLTAGCECRRRGLQIDLGLAAAGDAVQQRAAGRQRSKGLRGRLLRAVEPRRGSVFVRVPFGRAQTRDAACELCRIELAQLRRQHREREFTDAALVVAGSESDELPPNSRQGRHGVEHVADGLDLRRVEDRAGHPVPHDARHLPLTQRHPDQRSEREWALAAVVERSAEAGVLRRFDGDCHRALGLRQDTVAFSVRLHKKPLSP